MRSEEYVLSHNFGYGLELELKDLNKLYLRNIEDLKVYLFEVVFKNYIDINCLKNIHINLEILNWHKKSYPLILADSFSLPLILNFAHVGGIL